VASGTAPLSVTSISDLITAGINALEYELKGKVLTAFLAISLSQIGFLAMQARRKSQEGLW